MTGEQSCLSLADIGANAGQRARRAGQLRVFGIENDRFVVLAHLGVGVGDLLVIT